MLPNIPIITIRRGKSAVYFDIPADPQVWILNQDALFFEDKELYVAGTLASDHSTTELHRELKLIFPSI